MKRYSEIRSKIDEEINQLCDALFLKIDTYEEICKSKYKDINESKQKVNELIKSANDSIQQQKAYLRQLTINDNEVMACNQKMDELKKQIEKERKNLKKNILNNQIMKFVANKTKTVEEFLGTLKQQTFEFTVIFKVYFIYFYFLFNLMTVSYYIIENS